MIQSAKSIHIYNDYNLNMSAVKRIPVTEPVWKDLAEMRSAGQTYTDLLAEMIEDRKKRRLEEDVGKWSAGRKRIMFHSRRLRIDIFPGPLARII